MDQFHTGFRSAHMAPRTLTYSQNTSTLTCLNTGMDNSQLDDLKQFIQATVSQSEERTRTDLNKRIDDLEGSLTQEMRQGFEGVGDAID